MKTLFLKQALSLGMFAMAATGAFVSHAEKTENRALPVQQGFIKGNPLGTLCNSPKNCQTEDSGLVCRVINDDPTTTQMFGKVGGKLHPHALQYTRP